MKKYLVKTSILLLTVLIFNNLNIFATNNLTSVKFLSVGDSDCILIKSSKENLLIDLGEEEYVNNIVEELKKENIKEIDSIILTNFNKDRQGALEEVVKKFIVGKVYLPNTYKDESSKMLVINKLEKLNIPYDFIKKGWSYNKGNIYIEAKSPVEKITNEEKNSLVFYAVIDKIKYLFTSDFLFDMKEYSSIFGNIRGIDVLKVSNCGKESFTNKKFIKYVNPLISIISCENLDKCNVMNKLLTKMGSEVYDTKNSGNIKIQRDFGSKKINVITEK